jgi:hypothetical protein
MAWWCSGALLLPSSKLTMTTGLDFISVEVIVATQSGESRDEAEVYGNRPLLGTPGELWLSTCQNVDLTLDKKLIRLFTAHHAQW